MKTMKRHIISDTWVDLYLKSGMPEFAEVAYSDGRTYHCHLKFNNGRLSSYDGCILIPSALAESLNLEGFTVDGDLISEAE